MFQWEREVMLPSQDPEQIMKLILMLRPIVSRLGAVDYPVAYLLPVSPFAEEAGRLFLVTIIIESTTSLQDLSPKARDVQPQATSDSTPSMLSSQPPTRTQSETYAIPAAPASVVAPVQIITAWDHLNPHWYMRCVMYMVAFLHTKHCVTFRAAALLLICLGFIFSTLAGDLVGAVSLPRTLKTVFANFKINDNFAVHPVCFHCHFVFPPDVSEGTFCSDCDEEVFGAATRDADFGPPEDADLNLGDLPPTGSKKRKPYMVAPIQLLSTGLRDFFKRPGMVSAVDAWKTQIGVDGELRCMQDGEVWKEIKDANEQPFFYGPDSDQEFVWESVLAWTGSVEVKLQGYLKIIVDDLIMLYDEGIVVKTPEYPDGKRVRVALVAIIADHPAMCKLCGFADHSHKTMPCTKCEVSHDDLLTDKSLRNKFPARDGEEHRRLCKMHKELSTQEEKDEFLATYGAQWTEIARIDYFDLVRYTIVDPMHNLLLGVAKNQWFARWIETGTLRANRPQTARELNIVHEFLEDFESPLWAGHLPLRVGEAAGGSLTADEYKFAKPAGNCGYGPRPRIITTNEYCSPLTLLRSSTAKLGEYFAKLLACKSDGTNWVFFRDRFRFAMDAAGLSDHFNDAIISAEPVAPNIVDPQNPTADETKANDTYLTSSVLEIRTGHH
ncbi:hypothetical protein GGX14DRAFT_568891 [Mycena pura]|uniref:Uncharacterized protein n=1 Tax=Mycena pura TaxID=153505 RepID=A0AAD6Y7H7_9AGAR|nr:hypothetical protein GGX14DRAFT_568891 [Mycena pura]